MAYIYKIYNDVNNKLYIGQTGLSIEDRLKKHCYDINRLNSHFYKAMRKYGIDKFHIELIEETDIPNEREKYWIKYYDSYNNGYNSTLGGEGCPRIDYKEILRLWNQGLTRVEIGEITGYGKEQLCKILKENGVSHLELRQRIKKTQEKPVNQFDKDNVFIQTFDNQSEAARWLINNNYTDAVFESVVSSVSRAAKGQRKTYKNFIWKYVE